MPVPVEAPKPHKPIDNGFGQCAEPDCGRPVHQVSALDSPSLVIYRGRAYTRHDPIPRTRAIPDRERRFCSVCSRPGEWYDFKPGSGECQYCQP